MRLIHLRWWVLHDVTVVRWSRSDEGILQFAVVVAELTEVEGVCSRHPRVVRGRLSGRGIVLVEGGVTANRQKANSALLCAGEQLE